MKKQISTILQTAYGPCAVTYYAEKPHQVVAFAYGDISRGTPIVRIHSECLFGEVFHSSHCDCAQQIDETIRQIKRNKSGVIVYSFQEGRGVGLKNKIRAMELQRLTGMDTVEAFKKLRLPLDRRTFAIEAACVRDIGTSKTIRLFSDNLKKKAALERAGFEIVGELAISHSKLHDLARWELDTKQKKMNHKKRN